MKNKIVLYSYTRKELLDAADAVMVLADYRTKVRWDLTRADRMRKRYKIVIEVRNES